MPTITTTPAGQIVAANAQARRQAEAADARRAARKALDEQQAKKADTTTPLVGSVPLATVPELPTAAPAVKGTFALSTTIEHRGRAITIQASGITIDQFCDLLDERQYHAPLQLAAPIATADDLPEGYKLCRKHGAPMKPRSKQGDIWNSHNVGTTDAPCWCKGYRGPDSPGYEVE